MRHDELAGVTVRGDGILPSNFQGGASTAASAPWPTSEQLAAERPWTHPLLAFALTSLTFGLYGLYWLFDTWREIKRYDRDTGKSPVGHVLAMFVPVYNLFRIHAHMRAIVELVHACGGRTNLSAGTVVLLWMVAGALTRASDRPHLELLLLVAAVVYGGIVAWGQAALNQAWSLHAPQAPARPTHPAKWVVLGVGAVISVLNVIGLSLPA